MTAVLTSAFSADAGERAYRAYRLTATGTIQGVDHIDAPSDDSAMALAGLIANSHGIDLWERSRFLGHFPALSANALGAKG